MKNVTKLIAGLCFTMLTSSTFAQAPQKFNYQGIARNTAGQPLTSAALGLRLTIHDGSATGTAVYQETQAVTTNGYGLYSAAIGNGTVVTGTFAGVNWGTGDKYLQVEIDPAGGTSYTDMGSTQLLSVPYAMYAGASAGSTLGGDVTGTASANTVGKIQGVNVATTSPATGQTLKFNGSAYAPAADNDVQTLSIAGTTISISGGNSIVLPASSGITGTGTTNFHSKFTAAGAIGNSLMYDDGTSVAIGTTSPSSGVKFTSIGSATATAIRGTAGTPSFSFSVFPGVYGESANAPGVIGASSNQNGVLGGSAAANYGGVAGNNSNATGYGVWGSVSAAGIAGYFDGGTTGRGVVVPNGAVGVGTSAPNGRLVVTQTGTTGIDTAAAIYGFANGTVSCYKGGVFGTYNTSNYGVGLQGIGYQGVLLADAPASFPNLSASSDFGIYGSGATAGVVGASLAGSGVRGFSSTSQGLLGYSQAATTGGTVGVGNTIGVFANAVTVGTATVPATRYGVYGQASGATTNWAGFFNGNVNVVGSLAKGSGTFKIDHPLDPENKYLYHSFVESPDMMNIYNGNATTDAAGYVTVTMPDYFEALNKEFRYQLTVIGTFAQAIVKDEMSGNKFTIQTNQPGVKVSWQVTGVRHDKYADAHRVEPEVEKEAENKGLYLYPAEWNQPAQKGITYNITHQQELDAAKMGREVSKK